MQPNLDRQQLVHRREVLFSGSQFQLPELRLTLPGAVDVSPPVPSLLPQVSGAGACFFEGVANCLAGTGRRTR